MHDDDKCIYKCTDQYEYNEYRRNKGSLPKLRKNARWSLKDLTIVERHSPYTNKPKVMQNGANDIK